MTTETIATLKDDDGGTLLYSYALLDKLQQAETLALDAEGEPAVCVYFEDGRCVGNIRVELETLSDGSKVANIVLTGE
jgi:hypothetical protein